MDIRSQENMTREELLGVQAEGTLFDGLVNSTRTILDGGVQGTLLDGLVNGTRALLDGGVQGTLLDGLVNGTRLLGVQAEGTLLDGLVNSTRLLGVQAEGTSLDGGVQAEGTLLDGLEDSTRLLGVQVVLILAYSIIIVLGVTGNSLVIYVVYKFRNLRTVTNFFIVNLAVADLLVNTLCLPFTLVSTLHGQWRFGQVMCYLLPYAQGLAVNVSTITLNVIALDRYRSIVHHTETKMTKDVCALVIAITWLTSAVLASPLAIFREYVTFDLTPEQSIQGCAEKWPGSSTDGLVYSVSMFLLQYGLPLAVISFAYARIWRKLGRQASPGGGRSERHRRRAKTTKMLAAVVAVFALSWLPFHAFQLAVDVDSSVLEMKDFKLLYTAFHIVAMCSAFANPVLYGWMNRNYRGAFAAVCKCKCKCRAPGARLRRVVVVRDQAPEHQSTISVLTQANTHL